MSSATLPPTPAAAAAAATSADGQVPPPRDDLMRSDPFQFGSRLLSEGDDVFAFNAWDHVEVDDEFKEFAEQQYTMQRETPVSEFDKSKSGARAQEFFLSRLPDEVPTEKHSSSESLLDDNIPSCLI
jgi:hypothetical protein